MNWWISGLELISEVAASKLLLHLSFTFDKAFFEC
jgi:hypothetical protein